MPKEVSGASNLPNPLRFNNLAQAFHSIAKDNQDSLAYKTPFTEMCFPLMPTIWQQATYGELANEVKKVALSLQKLGVSKGTHVGIISINRPELLEVCLATFTAGGVICPLGVLTSPKVKLDLIDKFDIEFIFVQNQSILNQVLENCQNLPKLKAIFVFDPYTINTVSIKIDSDITVHSYEDLKHVLPRLTDHEFNYKHVGLDDIATILCTSATNGNPKGAVATHLAHLSQIDALLKSEILEPKTIKNAYFFIPLGHAYGFSLWLVEFFAVKCICLPRISDRVTSKITPKIKKLIIKDLALSNPDVVPVLPIFLTVLRKKIQQSAVLWPLAEKVSIKREEMQKRYTSLKSNTAKLSLLAKRFIIKVLDYVDQLEPLRKFLKSLLFGKNNPTLICGGGALQAEDANFYKEIKLPVLGGYGTTEGTTVVACQKKEDSGNHVGLPLPGIEVRINENILELRTNQLALGYYKDNEATNKVFKDGWYNTRDLATIDSKGRIYIHGRVDDILVLSTGNNISAPDLQQIISREFDDFLINCTGLSQVVILGQNLPFVVAAIGIKANKKFSYNGDHDQIKQKILAGFSRIPNLSKIKAVMIIDELVPGAGLSQKFEPQRQWVTEKYQQQIIKIVDQMKDNFKI